MSDSLTIALKARQRLIDSLVIRRKALKDGLTPALDRAFTRVGMILVTQAKINIRRHGLIDEGRLLNSIRFEPFRDQENHGIRFGSFGVPYAAFWEFGFNGVMKVRGHNRLITEAFGKAIKPTVVRVSPHSRTRHQRAKPYIRPAFDHHRERITKIIMEAFSGGT